MTFLDCSEKGKHIEILRRLSGLCVDNLGTFATVIKPVRNAIRVYFRVYLGDTQV